MDDDVIFFEHFHASNPQQKRQIESIKDSSLSALLTESRVESPANVMHQISPIASLHEVNDFPETSVVSVEEPDELKSCGEPRDTCRWRTFCGRLLTFFGLSKETEPINHFPSIQQRPLDTGLPIANVGNEESSAASKKKKLSKKLRNGKMTIAAMKQTTEMKCIPLYRYSIIVLYCAGTKSQSSDLASKIYYPSTLAEKSRLASFS